MNAMTDDSMNAAPAPRPNQNQNRARPRRRFWRLFWSIVLGLLAALALLLWWVLLSSSGARFALGFVPGLQVQTVSGHLVGPLTLDGVVYDSPLAALRAERIEADVRLWPLLSGAVQLDLLRTRAFELTLKPSNTPVEDPPPSGPLELPSLRVEQLDLVDTQLLGVAEAPILIQQLSGAVATGPAGVELRELRVRLPQGEIWANGSADPGQWIAQLQTRFTPTAGPAELAVVQLDLSSDGSKAVVALDIAGEETRLNVDIEQLQGDPRYSATVLSPGLDLARLGLPAGTLLPPVELRINGDAGSATLDGQITLAGQLWRLDGSALAWDAERITLNPLRIQPASGGEILAEGTVGVKDQAALLQISAQSLALSSLAGQADTDPASASLDLQTAALELRGSLLDWQLSGSAHLLRDSNDLRLNMDLAGNAQTLSVRQLRLLGSAGETALGELDVTGELGLAPPYALGLMVKADSFDTAALLPGWPGKLSLLAEVSGAVQEQINARIEQISGSLREAPISGSGDLSYDPNVTWPSGTLQLSWGGNSVDLDAAAGAPLVLTFELQQPALLDPQLSGSLSGSARLATDGTRLEIEAKGSTLAYAEQQLGALRLRADVGLDAAAPLIIELGVDDLSSAGVQQLQSLLLSSSGTVGNHQLQLRALSPQGAVALNAAGGWDGEQWQGLLNSLALNPGEGVPEEMRGKALSLQAPANLSLSAQRSELGQACLALDAARICLGGAYAVGAASQIDFSLSQLPLELARPWLEPAGLVFEGALDGEGQLNFAADGTPSGAIAVRGSDVELLLLGTELPKRFKFERFDIRIEPATVAAVVAAATAPAEGAAEAEAALATSATAAAPSNLQASVDLQIAKLGTLRLRSDLQGNTGLLEVDFSSLEALDDLSPDLVKPRGVLRGALRSDGGALSGQIALSQFSVELPGANLRITDGNVQLSGAPDRILIEGQLSSGEGQLQLRGEFRPEAGLAGLDLDITGENFLAADLPQVRLLISPALKLRGADGQLRITGDLGIPQGRVDLARFEPAISASADVVYVDAPPPEDTAGVPLFADINISFGDAVELRGFGLDGRIAGRLAVRERPGRPTTARGEITVSGTYKAYGQDLSIERGKLLFANSGLDNPGLDIRAARTIGSIKAGVQVRGSADAPELTTYSSPAMDQLNTISYLVLGRPASQAGDGAGGQAMQNAAQQLGGNLLAKSIGQKLGLEVGIESSAALGGASAFSVGKYLSPRLFVGYGRSLYEELQLFIVRYKLREHYEIEATSGREQKIGVNYRRER